MQQSEASLTSEETKQLHELQTFCLPSIGDVWEWEPANVGELLAALSLSLPTTLCKDWSEAYMNQPVITWGNRYLVTLELLQDTGVDVLGVFGQRIKNDALANGYIPIGEADVKVIEPDPAAPVPEEWEHLTYEQLPRAVVASVKAVRNH